MDLQNLIQRKEAQKIDEEVSKLIENQYKRAKKVLTENKEKLEKLANSLLENEVIFKSDLEQIFGKRKWKSYEEEKLIEIDSKKKKVEKNWTKIYSSNNPINAEIIKQMLEKNGINTVDINQQDSSYNMFGNIHLYVHQEYQRKALFNKKI